MVVMLRGVLMKRKRSEESGGVVKRFWEGERLGLEVGDLNCKENDYFYKVEV